MGKAGEPRLGTVPSPNSAAIPYPNLTNGREKRVTYVYSVFFLHTNPDCIDKVYA